jgi:hypothetical protein
MGAAVGAGLDVDAGLDADTDLDTDVGAGLGIGACANAEMAPIRKIPGKTQPDNIFFNVSPFIGSTIPLRIR